MASTSNKKYWLISVPSKGTVLQKHSSNISGADSFKFAVPHGLKVGTLDDLMSLSDDLDKYELTVASTARKLGGTFYSLIQEDNPKARMEDVLLVNARTMDNYLREFRWDETHYSTRSSCRELATQIVEEVGEVEDRLREVLMHYQEVTQRINAADRQQNANLMMRDLADIVQPKDLPALGSQYFVTVLAVVPNYLTEAWKGEYETGFGSYMNYNPDAEGSSYSVPTRLGARQKAAMAGPSNIAVDDYGNIDDPAARGQRGFTVPAVVPGSSKLVHKDDEFSLFAVTLVRATVKDFALRAREKQFTIREYTPPKDVNTAGKRLVELLRIEKEERKTDLLNFCKAWFREVFSSWIHLKAVRTFVESVLRYGVPPDFTAILMLPHRSGDNVPLRKKLDEFYKHLSASHLDNDDDDGDAPSGAILSRKLYPYVYTEIDLHFSTF